MNFIKIKKLTKVYDINARKLVILNQLDLNIEPRSIIAIEGTSGSGKSTLLNIIGAIDVPNSGTIHYDDQELRQMSDKAKESLRVHKIGFVFQNHYLLPDFSVLENVMLPLLVARKNWFSARQQALCLLEMVDLIQRKDHYPSQISGGEMARAGVARALVGNKRLVLADEPTGNLDQANSDHIAELLWSLQKELSFSLIIVTHDRKLAKRAPIRYHLSGGKIRASA